MRSLIIPVIAILLLASFVSCNSSGKGDKTFCDTACLKDSIKFTGNHILKPVVNISASKCIADTLMWSYNGMGVNRKIGLKNLLNNTVHISNNYVKCYFNDTAYALLTFNDCATGRGYQVKLPFDKKATISIKSSGINNFDHKFSVTDDLIAYTDRGNIFVEEIATGKKAMMTFGKALEIDYDSIHEYIDSVNVTPTRIWVKVKIDNEWKVLEKNITLK
jgi:hypothetical protein